MLLQKVAPAIAATAKTAKTKGTTRPTAELSPKNPQVQEEPLVEKITQEGVLMINVDLLPLRHPVLNPQVPTVLKTIRKL